MPPSHKHTLSGYRWIWNRAPSARKYGPGLSRLVVSKPIMPRKTGISDLEFYASEQPIVLARRRQTSALQHADGAFSARALLVGLDRCMLQPKYKNLYFIVIISTLDKNAHCPDWRRDALPPALSRLAGNRFHAPWPWAGRSNYLARTPKKQVRWKCGA